MKDVPDPMGTRREFCAIVRTALDVCDAISAAGQEEDDRPRVYLESLERWSRGQEGGRHLAWKTRGMLAWATAARKRHAEGAAAETTDRALASALYFLQDGRGSLGSPAGDRLLRKAYDAFEHLTAHVMGDGYAPSFARMRAWYERRRREVASVADFAVNIPGPTSINP